ncbi:hypothetical protein NPIL_638181 [Nephila pilipes]|uniref:Uncharacterized protein n=1 Tax=Nephila pilipes TaxID=299642 RepID=A0A8X6PV26_NEPPI|nr:hypothetical protein NPIL_638181 [Nephila pilipes]
MFSIFFLLLTEKPASLEFNRKKKLKDETPFDIYSIHQTNRLQNEHELLNLEEGGVGIFIDGRGLNGKIGAQFGLSSESIGSPETC